MPKGSQKNKTSRDPVDGRASPGAVTEDEQMEEDGIDSLRPASTPLALPKGTGRGKGGKKRKTVEKVVDSGDEEEPVVNKPAPVKRARTKSAPVAPSAVEATEDELDTGAAEATEEKREKSAEDLSRERHGAKGRGYRSLAAEAGYDLPLASGVDTMSRLLSDADVVRLLRYVPPTVEHTSYSPAEAKRRMALMHDSMPAAAAREASSFLEPAMRFAIVTAVKYAMHRGVQKVQPIDMYRALEPYKDAIEYSSVAPPPGLVRFAKETPAVFRKEKVVRNGKTVYKTVPSKERILRPMFNPKEDDLKEFKDADRAARKAEAKDNAEIAAAYKELVEKHATAVEARRRTTISAN